MTYTVVAIRDRLSGFGSPLLSTSIELATRDFLDSTEDLPPRRKSDLSFYQLGMFDSESGLMIPNGVPVYVCSADSRVGEINFPEVSTDANV